MSHYFTIGELAEKTGLTPYTLRYYESAGLIIDIARRDNGRRKYSEDDLRRAILVTKLRASGMTVAEIRRFVELTAGGNLHEPAPREMLRGYRRQIIEQIHRLQEALDAVTALSDEDEHMRDRPFPRPVPRHATSGWANGGPPAPGHRSALLRPAASR